MTGAGSHARWRERGVRGRPLPRVAAEPNAGGCDRPRAGAPRDGCRARGRAAPLPPVLPVRGIAGPASRGGRRSHGTAAVEPVAGSAGAIIPFPRLLVDGRGAGRAPRCLPAGRHRRRADVSGPLPGRGGLRRLAPRSARRPIRWPARSAPPPAEGPPDAAEAAVVPCSPGRVSARPVDQVSGLLDDAVQQAAREEPSGVRDLRAPLPPVGRRAPRAAARPRLVGGARSRAPVGRCPRASWIRSRIPTA